MRWKSLVAEIERTSTARGRATTGKFSVEGFRLIERAFAAGASIESVVIGETSVSHEDLRARRLLDRLEKAGVEVVEAPDIALRQIIEGRETGTLAALLRIPEAPTLRTAAPERGPLRVLVAVGVDDPGNLGALGRTALAGGADAFVITGPGDPWHPRAVRISRGSLFRIPIVRLADSDELLRSLKSCEIETVAAVTGGGQCLTGVRAPAQSRWAICVGSEAFGLSESLVREMDHAVTIPMAGDVDSFSVHAAAAILLYALRERGGGD